MSLISLLSLTMAICVLAASPGPGVVATVALSLSSGLRAALFQIAGMVLGDAAYLLFAIFGLSIIAQALGQFFLVVKIAGGIYLIVLGVKPWLSKTQRKQELEATKAASSHSAFISGLLISLANPKVIIFYCGFLPTFVDLNSITLSNIAVVVGIIAVASFIILGAYALLASAARRLITNPQAKRNLDKAAGGVLIVVGVAIAVR